MKTNTQVSDYKDYEKGYFKRVYENPVKTLSQVSIMKNLILVSKRVLVLLPLFLLAGCGVPESEVIMGIWIINESGQDINVVPPNLTEGTESIKSSTYWPVNSTGWINSSAWRTVTVKTTDHIPLSFKGYALYDSGNMKTRRPAGWPLLTSNWTIQNATGQSIGAFELVWQSNNTATYGQVKLGSSTGNYFFNISGGYNKVWVIKVKSQSTLTSTTSSLKSVGYIY